MSRIVYITSMDLILIYMLPKQPTVSENNPVDAGFP